MPPRLFTHNGLTQTIKAWSRETSIPAKIIDSRLRRGHSIADALKPVDTKNKRVDPRTFRTPDKEALLALYYAYWHFRETKYAWTRDDLSHIGVLWLRAYARRPQTFEMDSQYCLPSLRSVYRHFQSVDEWINGKNDEAITIPTQNDVTIFQRYCLGTDCNAIFYVAPHERTLKWLCRCCRERKQIQEEASTDWLTGTYEPNATKTLKGWKARRQW